MAAAKVVGPMVGWGYGPSLLCASGVIVAYCILGGQISVMKTDALQLGVMLGGIGACIVALYARTGLPEGGLHVALVNVDFPISRFWYFMIVIGSGFVVGPDVYGRLFTARSPGAARRGALASGLALLVVSAAVVSIGVWARHFGKPPEGTGVLPWILKNELPVGLGGFLSLALLSAIISSADTCLMSAASTAEHDLLGGSRVGRTRLIAAGIGVVSLVIAGVEQDIISTMLLAYSLFNCGVIPPVAVAVLRGRVGASAVAGWSRPSFSAAPWVSRANSVTATTSPCLAWASPSFSALSLCGRAHLGDLRWICRVWDRRPRRSIIKNNDRRGRRSHTSGLGSRARCV